LFKNWHVKVAVEGGKWFLKMASRHAKAGLMACFSKSD
jgi:hypothetical protein